MTILTNYFNYFINPRKTHEQIGNATVSAELNTLWESSFISWIFFMCHTIYGLIFLVIGKNYVMSAFDFEEYGMSIGVDTLSLFRTDLFMTLMTAVTFPLFVFYIAKLWSYSIKFSVKLFECKDVGPERIEQVVVSALSSHALYVIPFIGGILKNIWYFVILYNGLRQNLKFSQTQAIFTIFLPFVILSFLTALLSVIVYIQVSALLEMIPDFWAAS